MSTLACSLSLFLYLLFACAAHYFFADTVFLASFACATLSSFQFSVLTVIVIVVVAVMGLTFVVWHSSPLIVVCRALVQNAHANTSLFASSRMPRPAPVVSLCDHA